ncbi:sel1 repeat family protein [Caulobacter sp. 17J80-11]|uniref:sel1 repeat family protein n=1 Tax=Caulobacter sp. 17J80-11 TaxID=2763502 RepID=UPI00165364D6|nr:sel1 repeat family protein [Caulobacter sp. 17J80-11]MBC6982146.1 sel1 repeat family protein [Caulobacter sp. 17J80-11]
MKSIVLALALALTAGASAQAAPAPAEPSQAAIDKAQGLLNQAQALQAKGDLAGALKLVGEAALAVDNPDLMHKLGHMYQTADAQKAVPDHLAQSLRWFKLAADRNQADSLAHYGQALIDGAGVKRDHAEGVRMLLDAREGGYHGAYAALEKIAETQKLAVECAVAMAARKGYEPAKQEELVMGRATKWYLVRSGAGDRRRGDTLSIYGARDRGVSESSAYTELLLSTGGFTRMETVVIPVGSDREFRYDQPADYVDASAQGERDAAEILAACKR